MNSSKVSFLERVQQMLCLLEKYKVSVDLEKVHDRVLREELRFCMRRSGNL